jgi:hypothetical protein
MVINFNIIFKKKSFSNDLKQILDNIIPEKYFTLHK